MKRAILAALALSASAFAAQAEAPAIADMAGSWTVDLRPNLTDETYTQPMVLKIAADKTVTGSFYNSDILAGRAGTAQGRTCVFFRTTDGEGMYHSTACLIDGKMVGQTWAEKRDFVLPWTAGRQ